MGALGIMIESLLWRFAAAVSKKKPFLMKVLAECFLNVNTPHQERFGLDFHILCG
jgi:hypothetical protein